MAVKTTNLTKGKVAGALLKGTSSLVAAEALGFIPDAAKDKIQDLKSEMDFSHGQYIDKLTRTGYDPSRVNNSMSSIIDKRNAFNRTMDKLPIIGSVVKAVQHVVAPDSEQLDKITLGKKVNKNEAKAK